MILLMGISLQPAIVLADWPFSVQPQRSSVEHSAPKAAAVSLEVPQPWWEVEFDVPQAPHDLLSRFSLESFRHASPFESTASESTSPLFINEQNVPASAENPVKVPEPLLFDLVRPLGARKGELEFNTLAMFPWQARNKNTDEDPFGSGTTTIDREGIEWAPEIEYALADNFAIEFEFPFERGTLEEYKLGLQWTIGTAFNNHYIHGFQVLVEPNTRWRQWNSTLLYIGGIRFDEVWSALFMIGGRMDLEGPNNSETFQRLSNISLFADLSEELTLGVETNYASSPDGSSSYIVVPQAHYEFTEHFELQAGIGFGVARRSYEQSAVIRVIYSR